MPIQETLAATDLNGLYLVVGTLFVMNLGAVGTGLVFLFKFIWNAASYKTAIDKDVEKLRTDLNAAHEKIRELRSGK